MDSTKNRKRSLCRDRIRARACPAMADRSTTRTVVATPTMKLFARLCGEPLFSTSENEVRYGAAASLGP